MDKLYEKILDSESKPFIWAYGRFKMNNTNKVNDIGFLSLQQYQILNTNEILSNMFGVDTSKKLKTNDFAFDSFIETFKKYTNFQTVDNPFDVDEMVEDEEYHEDGELEAEPMNHFHPLDDIYRVTIDTDTAGRLGELQTIHAANTIAATNYIIEPIN